MVPLSTLLNHELKLDDCSICDVPNLSQFDISQHWFQSLFDTRNFFLYFAPSFLYFIPPFFCSFYPLYLVEKADYTQHVVIKCESDCVRGCSFLTMRVGEIERPGVYKWEMMMSRGRVVRSPSCTLSHLPWGSVQKTRSLLQTSHPLGSSTLGTQSNRQHSYLAHTEHAVAHKNLYTCR